MHVREEIGSNSITKKPKASHSYFQLPFTNGYVAATYYTTQFSLDVKKRQDFLQYMGFRVIDDYIGESLAGKISTFLNHIYRWYDIGTPTLNLCPQGIYFGICLNRKKDIWLPGIKEDNVSYIDGTGIVSVEQTYKKLKIKFYYFAPFSNDAKEIIVLLVKVSSQYKSPIPNNKILTFFGFPQRPIFNSKKNIVYGNNFICKSLSSLVKYKQEENGFIFEFDIASLYPREEVWAGAVIAYSVNQAKSEEMINSYIGQFTPEDLLKNEIDWWNNWHKVEKISESLNWKQKKLYKQSTAILKMSQCREEGLSYGQTMGTLPPGHWNICWARDTCYTVPAFVASGHLEEAKAGLEFMLKAKCNCFKHFIYEGEDLGVGKDYQISVCRYLGKGIELTDDPGHQEPQPPENLINPNIEYDNFGLFLWAMGDYIKKSNDIEFLRNYWSVISEKIADVLIHKIDPNYGLIVADSSTWERHLDGRKHFAFTSIMAAIGLRESADMAKMIGDKEKERKYSSAAEQIRKGILKNLTDENSVIKGNLKEEGDYLNSNVVEAINLGLVEPESVYARNTLSALEKLKVGKGYRLVEEVVEYWNHDWIFIDLRIFNALRKCGYNKEADALIDWITEQANLNYFLIPEYYHRLTWSYDGAMPMVGYGAGAYILAIEEKMKNVD